MPSQTRPTIQKNEQALTTLTTLWGPTPTTWLPPTTAPFPSAANPTTWPAGTLAALAALATHAGPTGRTTALTTLAAITTARVLKAQARAAATARASAAARTALDKNRGDAVAISAPSGWRWDWGVEERRRERERDEEKEKEESTKKRKGAVAAAAAEKRMREKGAEDLVPWPLVRDIHAAKVRLTRAVPDALAGEYRGRGVETKRGVPMKRFPDGWGEEEVAAASLSEGARVSEEKEEGDGPGTVAFAEKVARARETARRVADGMGGVEKVVARNAELERLLAKVVRENEEVRRKNRELGAEVRRLKREREEVEECHLVEARKVVYDSKKQKKEEEKKTEKVVELDG